LVKLFPLNHRHKCHTCSCCLEDEERARLSIPAVGRTVGTHWQRKAITIQIPRPESESVRGVTSSIVGMDHQIRSRTLSWVEGNTFQICCTDARGSLAEHAYRYAADMNPLLRLLPCYALRLSIALHMYRLRCCPSSSLLISDPLALHQHTTPRVAPRIRRYGGSRATTAACQIGDRFFLDCRNIGRHPFKLTNKYLLVRPRSTPKIPYRSAGVTSVTKTSAAFTRPGVRLCVGSAHASAANLSRIV
jgi:hypothetical protein